MGQNVRVYQIDQMLSSGRAVPRRDLQERLGISWPTLKRDLALMKDQMNAPIVFDRFLGGYRYATEQRQVGPKFQLPGLWFSAEEIHALMTMHQLLSRLDTGGLLGGHVQPLLSRLTGLLGTADNPAEEVRRRVKILAVGARHLALAHFETVGSALLRRKRLRIRYHARGTDDITERDISPLRLVHYRDNWYLDAWCHLRNALRNFSVDAIDHAEMLDASAKDVSDRRLDKVLGAGYGIFSGTTVEWAVLRFTADRARWVAAEEWHPKQKTRVLEDGRYELRIPYADHRELIMDILKYGADCEVVAPEALRSRIREELRRASRLYGSG